MGCRINNLQVLYAIVVDIMIKMMDVFMPCKRTTDMGFHDRPVHIVSSFFRSCNQISLGFAMLFHADFRVSVFHPSLIMFTAQRTRNYIFVTLFAMLFIYGLVGCQHPTPTVVHTTMTVNCDPNKEPCFSVSRSMVDEHYELFAENIRLKAALKLCQEKPLSNP